MDNVVKLGRPEGAVPAENTGLLPEVLTVDELAQLLRVERKTAYAAVSRGEVRGVRRLGRCIRICRAAVLQWLDQGEGGCRRRGRKAA
jgi:excisionase family DNA binding protein